MSRIRPFAFEVTVVVLVLVLGGVVSLLSEDSDVHFEVVDENLTSIRTAFNAETDNVRAILLASPT